MKFGKEIGILKKILKFEKLLGKKLEIWKKSWKFGEKILELWNKNSKFEQKILEIWKRNWKFEKNENLKKKFEIW